MFQLTKEQLKELARNMDDRIRQTHNRVNIALTRLYAAQRWLASLERRTAELAAELREKDREGGNSRAENLGHVE